MTAPFSHDREPMPISARQITHGNILRVLLLGFTMVILLLVAAGFVGVRNIHSIQASAATLVGEQDETSNLIEEIERERGALNAVLYHLARDPESVDRQKVLSDLKTVDENLKEVVDSAAGTPEEALALELRRAALDFSEEARRASEAMGRVVGPGGLGSERSSPTPRHTACLANRGLVEAPGPATGSLPRCRTVPRESTC